MENKIWTCTLKERFPKAAIDNEEGQSWDVIQLNLNTGIKDDTPYTYFSVDVYTKLLKYGPHEFDKITKVHLKKQFDTLTEATEVYNNLKPENYASRN